MRFYDAKVMRERKDKMILASIAIVVILYTAFSLTYFSASAKGVRDDVVRLHILAESDSEKDQAVKLKVRDALLKANTSLLSKCVSKENAAEYFNSSKAELEKTANRVLKENGFDYTAKIKLCNEYYTTREYGDYTFPAGRYTSVKVVLGSGKGHNWWCVMFPPMCVPAASGDVEIDNGKESYLSENGEKVIESGKKYKVKFKILEWYEKLCNN